jgi:hypothetical protein
MAITPGTQQLILRAVRTAVAESTRQQRVPVRIGTISEAAPPGQVAQVILDEDADESVTTYAFVATTHTVQAGDRVRVEFAPPQGAWITAIVTPRARVPVYDESTGSSAASTGAVELQPDLDVVFTQQTAGMPVRGFFHTHYVSSDPTDYMLITTVDVLAAGITQSRCDVSNPQINLAQSITHSWIERPDAGVHIRGLAIQRISGGGNCTLFADADRPATLWYENAPREFPA